jgi:NADPH:quinone reductase-like Zn-dependent oxidoreductase
MQKIVIHRPGGFNRLKLESFPDPVPGDDQIVVKIKAIGVNYADCVIRMGFYASAKQYVGWPITPGFDFSGIVESVGKRILKFTPGDHVFGVSRFDAYATHVVVPENQLFHLPKNKTFEEAGAFATIYLTAYYALYMSVKLYPDSKILIHSAAGGVGCALLQLSKLAGWQTIGVVGQSNKVKIAKEMGANIIIDKSKQDLWPEVEKIAPDGLDAVLDGNGYITLRDGFNHLRANGKLIAYGFHSMFPRKYGFPNPLKLAIDYFRTPRFNPLGMHDKNYSLVTFNLSFLFHRTDLLKIAMEDLHSWFSEGKISMPPIKTYPFTDSAQAHRDLQSGTTAGKLVLLTEQN